MSIFVPPGYELFSDMTQRSHADADTLRKRLAAGERKGFKIRDDGQLEEISQSEWIAESGKIMQCGYHVERVENGWKSSGCPIVVKIAESVPAEIIKDRRGRKGYDWDPFWHEVVRIADLDGLPDTQAELETTMSKWCEKRGVKNQHKALCESAFRQSMLPSGRAGNRIIGLFRPFPADN